jgi:hypothetical protein
VSLESSPAAKDNWRKDLRGDKADIRESTIYFLAVTGLALVASRAKLINQQFVSGHPAGSQAYQDPLSMRLWAGQYCFGGFEGFWHGEFGRGRHLERLASLKNLLHVFRFQTLLSSTDTFLARFDCCTTSQDEIIVERPVSCCNFWQGLTLSLWLEKRTWRSDEDRMKIGWRSDGIVTFSLRHGDSARPYTHCSQLGQPWKAVWPSDKDCKSVTPWWVSTSFKCDMFDLPGNLLKCSCNWREFIM